MSAMSENVECGASTVVTAPFLREMTNRSWLDRVNAQCETLSAKLTVVWVSCDADSMCSYLKHRGAARDTWKLSNWDEYLSSIDLDSRPDFEHFLIDNSRDSVPLNDQTKELIEHIYRATQ